MSVNTNYGGVSNSYTNYQTNAPAKTETSEEAAATKAAEQQDQTQKEDTVTISNEAKKYMSSSKSTGNEKIDAMKMASDAKVKQLETLVNSMVKVQNGGKGVQNAWSKAAKAGNLKQFMSSLDVDAATSAQAQKDISDDGYWGSDATAQRMLDFAKAYAGDDPTKIAEMRAATEKGFKQAARAWGDTLPSVSQQTYDKVMESYDQWEQDAAEKVAGATAANE